VYYASYCSTPPLTIRGARIKSSGSGSSGRSVQISSNSSNAIRLANCVLIAAGQNPDYSIYAAYSGTAVQILNGVAANKDKHANVSVVGGPLTVDTAIS
jgi:hypothetical protein